MPRSSTVAAASALIAFASAQQIGTTPEEHPTLKTWQCTNSGGCVAKDTSVVLDWGNHWLRTADYNSCTTNSGLDPSLCGTEEACGKNCLVEGADYASAGVTTSGDKLYMSQYVKDSGKYRNASPRVYLLAPDGQNYVDMKLLNQEISFDVDGSSLVCGENGALYLSEMDMTGGRSASNPGGAAYGSGYCDAQCPVSTWFNGSVNTQGYGSCCNEMDLWEANANATAYTPHPCRDASIASCTGDACGAKGVCDKNGCGFNPYALGKQQYYGAGAGFTVNTLKPVTVTTQFLTNDGTTSGALAEIRRFYIQDGKVIANTAAGPNSGFSGQTSLTEPYCSSTDPEGKRLGGLEQMGEALGRGMVLIFSIWNDVGGYMNWLDSGSSGPCSATEGNPELIMKNTPQTSVIFSNVRWGDIGSTTDGKKPGSPAPSSSTVKPTMTMTTTKASTMKPTSTKASSTTSAAGAMQTHWGQCGGTGYSGPTQCAAPYTCKMSNPYYGQCL